MGRMYSQYKDKWAVYSTVIDGFITPLMSVEDLEQWRKEEYGRSIQPIQKPSLIDFDEAICNWLDSQDAHGDCGVLSWLEENNIEEEFRFICILDKENYYHCVQDE